MENLAQHRRSLCVAYAGLRGYTPTPPPFAKVLTANFSSGLELIVGPQKPGTVILCIATAHPDHQSCPKVPTATQL